MSNPGTQAVFDLTRPRVVELALTDCGVLGPGRRPTPEQYLHASTLFAELGASLGSAGVMRFLYERRSLSLVAGQKTYDLPDDVYELNDPLTYSDSSDPTHRSLWPLSIKDYMLLANRDVQSRPAQYMCEKKLASPGGEICTVTFYPVPDTTGATIEYPAVLKVRDMITDANTPSFPAKWLKCLRWGLDVSLSAAYKVPETRVAFFVSQFEAAKTECLANDHERVSMRVVPYGSDGGVGGSFGGGWY